MAHKWHFTAGVLSIVTLFGCSSSLFTGDKDSELRQFKGDGRFNKACMGLDLSKETLDVDTTVKLVNCLNGNGSIQSYADLVNMMSRRQLQAILDVTNEKLLSNHPRLKAMDRSLKQAAQLRRADGRTLLDTIFGNLARVLSNGAMIRYGTKLLRQGGALRAQDGSMGELDPAILKLIQILAREALTDAAGGSSRAILLANVKKALDQGVKATATRSYRAMVAGLRSTIPLLHSEMGVRYFARKGMDYLKAKIQGPHPMGKLLLWGIEDGSLLQGFDYYYGGECEDAPPASCAGHAALDPDSQVQAMEQFLRMLNVDHKEDMLKPMTELFRLMDGPIHCMADTKVVPNGDLYVMDELVKLAPLDVSQWSLRTNFLKLKLADSMCSFPAGPGGKSFNDVLEVLRMMADYVEPGDGAGGKTLSKEQAAAISRRPLITVAHLLEALRLAESLPMSDAGRADIGPWMAGYPQDERYRRFMIHWMGDKDEDHDVYADLSDALAELSRKERAVMGNALYFLNVPAPGSQDREDLRSAIRVLLKHRPELKTLNAAHATEPASGRSIYDVLADVLLKVDSETVAQLLLSLRDFLDSGDAILYPLLETTRESLLMNNVTPMLDLALEVGLDAEKNKDFFNVLFEIADTPQFVAAMGLTAKMAGNGSLKDLVINLLAMFDGTLNRVPGEPELTHVPPAPRFDPKRDMATFDPGDSSWSRPAWNPLPANWPAGEHGELGMRACARLNVSLPVGRPFATDGSRDNSTWDAQMEELAACVDATGDNAKAASLVRYALDEKVRDDRSLLATLADLAAGLIPGHAAAPPPGMGFETWLKNVYSELGDLLIDDSSFRDMRDMNDLMPFLFGKAYCTDPYDETPGYKCATGTERLSVMQAMNRALGAAVSKRSQLQDLLSLGRDVVQDARLPKSVALVYDLDNDADRDGTPIAPDPKVPLESWPLNAYPSNEKLTQALDNAIRKYEKREPNDRIRAEKYEAYWRQPTPHEDKRYLDYRGRSRIGFKDADDLKSYVKPLLDQLSRDNRLEWLQTFHFHFDHSPYTPEWWEDWYRRNAADIRPIPYYYPGKYPGKDQPVVRLMSMLDVLDLIVADSDFSLRDMGESAGFLFKDMDENTGIKYLTLIAQSGDDLTKVLAEMKRELDFFASLSDGPLGFVLKDETRRRLFNLTHIYPFFREINRVTTFTGSDGRAVAANDLGVLRDLFKSILGATPNNDPRDNPDLFHRDKNSLAVIADLVKLGPLHNAGPGMWFLSDGRAAPTRISHILKIFSELAFVVEGGHRRLNKDNAALMGYLVREDCDRTLPKYRDSCLVQDPSKEGFNERYVFIGKLIDRVFHWTRNDDWNEDHGQPRVMTYLKRAAYDLTSLVERLDATSTPRDLPKKMAAVTRAALGSAQGARMLADNLDLMDDLMATAWGPRFLGMLLDSETSQKRRGEQAYPDSQAFAELRGLALRALDELSANGAGLASSGVDLVATLYNDPAGSMKAAGHAAKWMSVDADYLDFKSRVGSRVTANIVHWLPKTGTPERPRDLAPRLVQYTGDRMADGTVRDLLLFVGGQSIGTSKDRFYSKTRFLGDPAYVYKLNDFMETMRSGIEDVER